MRPTIPAWARENRGKIADLLEDQPAHGLVVGDVGTVVFAHHSGKGYEVEFMDTDGCTLVVETLQAHQVAPLRGRQILHVRPLSAA